MNEQEKLIAPGLFLVKADVGDTVYFFLENIPVEGKVVGYFGHITPDEKLESFEVEGGAKPAEVTNIGYCVEYYIPISTDIVQRQVYLLDESEFFFTEEELTKDLMNKTIKLPKK